MTKIRVTVTDRRQTERLLSQMPRELRGKQLKKAVRSANNIVATEARRRVPKPGYPGDKPDKKPLRDTIKVVVREGSRFVASFVGPTWPDGAHGHLVEHGHFTVTNIGLGFVAGRPFLRPAADLTEPKQRQVIIKTLKNGIRDLAK